MTQRCKHLAWLVVVVVATAVADRAPLAQDGDGPRTPPRESVINCAADVTSGQLVTVEGCDLVGEAPGNTLTLQSIGAPEHGSVYFLPVRSPEDPPSIAFQLPIPPRVTSAACSLRYYARRNDSGDLPQVTLAVEGAEEVVHDVDILEGYHVVELQLDPQRLPRDAALNIALRSTRNGGLFYMQRLAVRFVVPALVFEFADGASFEVLEPSVGQVHEAGTPLVFKWRAHNVHRHASLDVLVRCRIGNDVHDWQPLTVGIPPSHGYNAGNIGAVQWLPPDGAADIQFRIRYRTGEEIARLVDAIEARLTNRAKRILADRRDLLLARDAHGRDLFAVASAAGNEAFGEWLCSQWPGLSYRRTESFECGGRTWSVPIYRSARLASILGLDRDVDDPTCEFVLVPPGIANVGSPDSEPDRDADEGPQYAAWVAATFVARTEVTRALWIKTPTGPDIAQPSWVEAVGNAREPADYISREQGLRWAAIVGARLPTELEWEYAARGGATSAYHWGTTEDVGAYAWFDTSAEGTCKPVAQLRPNAFGLFDTAGNVYEWCSGFYSPTLGGQPDPARGVFRGGSFARGVTYARSANRSAHGLKNPPASDVGIRLFASCP